MTSSIFSAVEMAPRDPIIGLNELFNADTRSIKVNLGVGVYFDDNGKIMAYHSVRRKPSSQTISLITQVYAQMLSIEAKSGVEASAKYLFDLLKQKGVSYDEFIFSLKS